MSIPLTSLRQTQGGSFILEALIAILIFAMGILGLVSMQASAVSAAIDTRYRVEANQFAERILATMQANAVRTGDAAFRTSLDSFAHNPSGGDPGTDQCAFSGNASTNPLVVAWLNDLAGAAAAGRLPGATAQIRLNWAATGTANQLRVIVCWQQPGFSVRRRHVVTGSIS